MVDSKKGLSDIVTNVLIILLVLVAIGVIWAFVSPVIKNSAGQTENVGDQYGTTLKIKPSSVIANGNTLSMIVERNEGNGALIGFNIIVEDTAGTSKVFRNDTIIERLGSQLIVFNVAGSGLGTLKTVSVAPIFALSGGEERTAPISSSAAVPTNTAAAACPNGVKESGEACDGTDFAPLGNSCSANSGLAHTYYNGLLTCTGSCTFNEAGCSEYCGDSVVNGPEQCEGSTVFTNNCNYLGNPNYLNGSGTCNSGTCGITCDQCTSDFENDGDLDSQDCEYASSQGIDVDGSGFVNGDDYDLCSVMTTTSTKYCTIQSCCDANNGFCGSYMC